MLTKSDLSHLVDLDKGTLSARIFSDADIYQLELEKIFAKSWLFLGHESLIPKANDFIATYMAEDPILLIRDNQGEIGAFLNQCRHRGMPVNSYERGNARAHTCPYHGWSYDTSGQLVAVPMDKEAFKKCLNKAEFGLIKVPRVESYKGLIFGNWDENCRPLIESLGDMAWYADSVIDRDPEGMEVVGGIYKWVIPCNWKLAAEQFCTDMYHVGLTHLGTLASLVGGEIPPGGNPATAPGRQFVAPEGHGTGFFLGDDQNAIIQAVLGLEVAEYYNGNGMELAEKHLGEARARGMSASHSTIFPNLSFLGGINTLRVWHPRGPDSMEVWAIVLAPSSAPRHVKQAYSRGVGRTFSPSGIFEQDDGENWTAVQKVLRGYVAKKTRFNAQMGMGYPDLIHPAYPKAFQGTLTNCFSEAAARGFYGQWIKQLQDAAE